VKKLEKIKLFVPQNWLTLDNCDGFKGYFLGLLTIHGKHFHVEAIEARVKKDLSVVAFNPDFQNRIDSWCTSNGGGVPQLMRIKEKEYFINIEPYAD